MPELDPAHLPGPHPRYYNFTMEAVMAPLLLSYGGVQSRGADVLSDIDGAFLMSSVHRSQMDTPAISQVALREAGIQIHWMCKEEMWEQPKQFPAFGRYVVGPLIEYGGGFPVDRDELSLSGQTKAHVEHLIENGAAIGLYPEGTRKKGEVIDAKKIKGAHTLAAEYGIPIVPAGIAGTEKGHRRPIRIVFGDPIEPNKVSGDWRAKAREAKRLKLALGDTLQELQDEAVAWRTKSKRLHRA